MARFEFAVTMGDQPDNLASFCPLVKATIQLGQEKHYVEAKNGILSEQLISMKEQSMSILKEFITRHNVPIEVPDEPDEVSSDDGSEVPEKPPKKRK